SSTAGPAHSESIPELIATSSQKPTLDAYDISYWIKKGPNTIVATVRNTQGPARFLASGFMVRKDGNIQQFETNSDWRVGDRHGASLCSRSGRATSCPNHRRPALPAPSKVRLSFSNKLAVPTEVCCAGDCHPSRSSVLSLRSARANNSESQRTDSAAQKHHVCRGAALSTAGNDHRLGLRIPLP